MALSIKDMGIWLTNTLVAWLVGNYMLVGGLEHFIFFQYMGCHPSH
jgi:hypothetical protein